MDAAVDEYTAAVQLPAGAPLAGPEIGLLL